MDMDNEAISRQQEQIAMKAEHIHGINCEAHGCMDGRPVLFKAQKVEGIWKIAMAREVAEAVVEAKLPGGALGFIAALEKQAGLTQDEAIELTEKGLKELGMVPQFHIDNDHGHFDTDGKTDEELFTFIEGYVGGCGFAARTWGEGAEALLRKLIDRGWLVEVLDGHHEEKAAKRITKEGVAIDTKEATEKDDQSFTFNEVETRKALEAMNLDSTIVEKSMEWYRSEFGAIANAISKGSITEVKTL